MWSESLKKYGGIYIAIAVSTLFFIGYLVLNSVLQSTSVKAASYSSFVGQLSMSTAQLSGSENADIRSIRESLNALEQGGSVELADGSSIAIVPLSDFLASNEQNISAIQGSLDKSELSAAHAGVLELAQKVDAELDRKVRLIEIFQIMVGIFVLMMSGIFTLLLVRRLSQSEEVEVKTKQEAEGILNTVSEGLFLLGRDHEIGIEQSASLKEMFKQERDLEGNFFDFISQYVTQGDLKVAKDYLELLFGERVKEKLVASLNPLTNVEINIARRDGSFENRYLDFHFKRVVENGQLKHLLGSVNDVTKQVLLEQELAQAKEEQEAQIDLLKSILHIDNTQLTTFFRTAEADLNEINQTLESHDQKLGQSAIRSMLAEIAQNVHKIKGDAAALGLHQFEFSSHEFEDAIKEIESTKEKVTGKELLPLTSNLRGMFKDLESMRALVDKFSGSFGGDSQESSSQATAEQNDGALESKVRSIVQTVGERNNKRVQLTMFGLNPEDIPQRLEDDLGSILAQLTRNAIVHGAEAPEHRLKNRKPDFMSLGVSLTRTSRGYELLVRDDGKGVDAVAVMTRAVELGLAPESSIASATTSNCMKYLFHPGFSSAAEASLDAGRGEGLGLVRKILKDWEGKISVRSEKGSFCQFHILLPSKNTTKNNVVDLGEASLDPSDQKEESRIGELQS